MRLLAIVGVFLAGCQSSALPTCSSSCDDAAVRDMALSFDEDAALPADAGAEDLLDPTDLVEPLPSWTMQLFWRSQNDIAGWTNGSVHLGFTRINSSRDNGTTWVTSWDGVAPDERVLTMWADGPESVFAGGYEGRRDIAVLLRTEDAGKTWRHSPVPNGLAQIIRLRGAGAHLYAVAIDPLRATPLMLSHDQGRTWALQTLVQYPTRLRCVRVIDARGSAAVAGGDGDGKAVLLRSSDQGKTWTDRSPPDKGILLDLWSLGGERMVAVGEGGLIVQTNDGRNWMTRQSGVKSDLNGIWGAAGSPLYVVGGNQVLVSSDGGITWGPEATPTPPGPVRWNAVWGTSSRNVFVVGTMKNDETVLLHYH